MYSKRHHATTACDRLVWVWAAYFSAVLTVGRFEAYRREIIWGGAAILSIITLKFLMPRLKKTPQEVVIVALFLVWTFTASPKVVDWGNFAQYWRLIAQFGLLVFLMSAVIRHSSSVEAFFWAFLVNSVFTIVWVWRFGSGDSDLNSLFSARVTGITGGANALGFTAFLGVFGALALAELSRGRIARATLAVLGIISFVGMVLAGSRGAYLAFLLTVFGWPLICWDLRRRRRARYLAATVVLAPILYISMVWVQQNTVLGARIRSGVRLEDSSVGMRVRLAKKGVEMAASNPFVGVGLGQFGRASGLGLYAHNEIVELMATTGFTGFLLFLALYIVPFFRIKIPEDGLRDLNQRRQVRIALLALIVTFSCGALFRINFIVFDTIFLLAMVIGVSYWRSDAAIKKKWLMCRYGSAIEASKADRDHTGVH